MLLLVKLLAKYVIMIYALDSVHEKFGIFAFEAKCSFCYVNVHFLCKRSRNGRGRLLRHLELVYR